ncbi:MAG TPA: SDR family oxidoreductase [Oscillatoriaceae cyanobacterium]
MSKTVLITGASSGIGEAFARAVARRGHVPILVARRADRLAAIAAELAAAHGVEVPIIPLDLLAPDAAERLFAEVSARGLAVDWLVNNAGFGLYGPFATQEAARVHEMLQLNVLALTALCHRFAPGMRARRNGAIVNVASVAAFQPVPELAVYSASKAYVLSFSEALAEELRPDGIYVQALCPGTTRTEFFGVAGFPDDARSHFMTPEAVVEASLAGLARGASVVVPGTLNRLVTTLGRFVPRRLLVKLAARAMRDSH